MDLQKEYQALKDKFAEGELLEEFVLSEGELTLSAAIKDVKITHVPTGTEVVSDQYATQLENGIAALKQLIERLKGHE